MVSVEFPETVILVGLKEVLKPLGFVADNDTVPVKPFRPATVTDVVPEAPGLTFTGETILIAKSGKITTLTDTWTECDREPLAPVMFML